MQVAATITHWYQCSPDDFTNVKKTKVFTQSNTIEDIINWAKTIDKSITFAAISFSDVSE